MEAQEWHSAVNMYRSNEMWEDAFRVAKFYGGNAACKRVTIALLMVESSKLENSDQARIGRDSYRARCRERCLGYVFNDKRSHYQYKNTPFFLRTMKGLVKLKRPLLMPANKETIDMYVHQQDWASAMRVAESHDPTTMGDVLVAQARTKADAGNFRSAEELYLSASRPELALVMYQEADRWPEALKLAQLHLPHRLTEINMAYQQHQAKSGRGGSKSDFVNAGRNLENAKQWSQAIDSYLKATKDNIDNVHDLEDLWARLGNSP